MLAGSSGPPPIPTENKAPCPACPGTLSEVLLGAVHVDYCAAAMGCSSTAASFSAAVAAVQIRDRETKPHDIVIAISSVAG